MASDIKNLYTIIMSDYTCDEKSIRVAHCMHSEACVHGLAICVSPKKPSCAVYFLHTHV